MLQQNDLERIKDLLQRGVITVDQANVEMVRDERVTVVRSSIPQSVRKALNAAVKSGYLGHMKKDGHKPEVYFHPNFDHLARAERNETERKTLEALLRVCI